MGMHNEVYTKCPRCRFKCTMQITQIVLGNGNFDIDDLKTFSHLSDSEIMDIRFHVANSEFHCIDLDKPNAGCGHVFNPLKPVMIKDRIRALLFGK